MARRLPTLANHCFIVGEAKRADVIWSEGDFTPCASTCSTITHRSFLVGMDRQSKRRSRNSKRPVFDIGRTSARGWRGLPSPEKPQSRGLSAFIPRIQRRSPGGLQLILMLTTESSSKRGNGRRSFLVVTATSAALPYPLRVRQRLSLIHLHPRIVSSSADGSCF